MIGLAIGLLSIPLVSRRLGRKAIAPEDQGTVEGKSVSDTRALGLGMIIATGVGLHNSPKVSR